MHFMLSLSLLVVVTGCVDKSKETKLEVPTAKARASQPGDSVEPDPKPAADQPSSASQKKDGKTPGVETIGAVDLVSEEPESKRPIGTVWVPGGAFQMGSDGGQRDELPMHTVELDGFWMDATEVTNAEFKRFVDATGYKTIAEKKPTKEDFAAQLTPEQLANINEADLQAGSVCFNPKFDRASFPQDRRPNAAEIYLVWKYEKGANWLHPKGPDSNLEGKMNHPVAHVAWDDCVAYCEWAGKRLPTEAEWEYAARGGEQGKTYPWGDNREIDGKWMANIWQGKFPFKNYAHDGFEETSPVKSYPANPYGLYDMSGNVWEWCHDFYRPDYYIESVKRNPTGPRDSFDPNEPRVPKRIQRGGSFMCNVNYCTGYRVAARMKGDLQTGTWHCGFRCVVPAKGYKKFAAAKGAQFENTDARQIVAPAPGE